MNTREDDFWAWVSLGWALGIMIGLAILWIIRHPSNECAGIYFREAHQRCLMKNR